MGGVPGWLLVGLCVWVVGVCVYNSDIILKLLQKENKMITKDKREELIGCYDIPRSEKNLAHLKETVAFFDEIEEECPKYLIEAIPISIQQIKDDKWRIAYLKDDANFPT